VLLVFDWVNANMPPLVEALGLAELTHDARTRGGQMLRGPTTRIGDQASELRFFGSGGTT
jgi:hypothetical protein